MNIEERSPIHHVKVEVEDKQDVEDVDYDFNRKYVCYVIMFCYLLVH